MRTLAVAQIERAWCAYVEKRRQSGFLFRSDLRQSRGDRAVVSGRKCKGLLRKTPQSRLGKLAVASVQFLQNPRIVVGRRHDSDVLIVLRRGANQRWPADVYVLYELGHSHALFSGHLFE